MCWLTPKLECGNSENLEIEKLGLSSQSGGGFVADSSFGAPDGVDDVDELDEVVEADFERFSLGDWDCIVELAGSLDGCEARNRRVEGFVILR
jgi:hypothetical protein